VKKKLIIYLTIGFILVVLSIWQIATAQKGLNIVYLKSSNPPVTIIYPKNTLPASRPTVLIAHGFSGSSVLMRGFALTLAHAGYTTISWDFQGHGENPNPLISSSRSDNLLLDAESALSAANATGIIDPKRIAILGHSMGSGVAIAYGNAHPNTAATIAVSPVNQTVTASLPYNLLLMAGSLEPQFLSNAEQLLAMAGGQAGELSMGTARKLITIPGVEHISILFSPKAHGSARAWLNGTFGPQQGAADYTDRRVLWFGLGIIGFIMLGNAGINMIPASNQPKSLSRPLWLRMLALFFAGIGATLILWLVGLSGVKTNQSFGLIVGGYVILWFGISGILSVLIVRPVLYKPTIKELGKGLLAFVALWLGVGLLGNFVWLPWFLIPTRLLLWLPSSLILLPWFFAVGNASRESKPIGQFGWWTFQALTILLSLLLAIRINPQLGFLFILLPLVPVIIGLHMLLISSKHGVWAYAFSGAMFTAWLILAVFPLQ
jgi:pimeloyl-ACP methyl ester carboxylesterase